MVLETAGERIKLLKTGTDCKQIEHLYVKANGFKVVNTVLKEPAGIEPCAADGLR